jgi:hypothetical protein
VDSRLYTCRINFGDSKRRKVGEERRGQGMARLKGTCSKCGKTISLLFEYNNAELADIKKLKDGEFFEHKCPVCDEWSAFEVAED